MIEFLEIEDVIQIHEDQIQQYGGRAGVNSPDMLHSALAQPCAMFGGEYLHTDIYHMAAAYLFHLCENHPFFDGNKRTAAMAAFVFLKLNGYTLTASETEFEALVWNVANGKADKISIRAFFAGNVEKSP